MGFEMNRKTLLDIVDLGAALKADTIAIIGNKIIGTDENMTYFKVSDFDNINNYLLIYNVNEMREFLRSISIIDTVSFNGCDIASSVGGRINTFNNDKLFNINSCLSRIGCYINSINPIIENKELKEDDGFNSLLQYKSGNGVGLYKISEEFILSIFKNMLPINKNDYALLNIYDIDSLSFLSKFTIIKKKNIHIRVYIMYRHLNNASTLR